MQILGKRSKILLILVAIAMLVAIGVSFAVWDTSAVKANNGELSSYANAKVGDVIEFGKYYQTGKRINNDENAEYEKTPIEWIVVDKDERTGQLTLMSKYILASGSYFGNYHNNSSNVWGAHYDNNSALSGIPYNQAYVDSTVRAYLNNLERLDMGGDDFLTGIGYAPSKKASTLDTGLRSSVGFSNQIYWTGLSYSVDENKALVNANNKGLYKNSSNNEIYYQRPINNAEFRNRPATRGFFNEAFTYEEKSMIMPKVIAGYTGHRWPDNAHDVSTKSYVEGALDKVWIPSVTELNVMKGKDWLGLDDKWTSPSDESSSEAFDYFRNLSGDELTNALKATRTTFATNSFAMNYSIPVYSQGTTNIYTDIHAESNSLDHYWTRSPMSYWFPSARIVYNSGVFNAWTTHDSRVGVRPCVILKY